MKSLCNHVFKEGDSVTGGGVVINSLNSVLINEEFTGISVTNYIDDLNGKVIVGSISGIRAKLRHI